jgi:hypothetical protein
LAINLVTMSIYLLSPSFRSLEQLDLNKNRLKNIKYPSNLPSPGLLGDAVSVPFENLQVLLLGISFVGVALFLLHIEKIRAC